MAGQMIMIDRKRMRETHRYINRVINGGGEREREERRT